MKRKHRKRLLVAGIVLAVLVTLRLVLPMPAPRPPTVWTAPVRMASPPPHVMTPLLPVPEMPSLLPAANIAPALPRPEEIPPLPAGQKPRIAIVIDDVGLNAPGSARAVRLPAPITLSYLPYAPNLSEQTDGAKAAGHELLLHMPMEPVGHDNPGPGALLTSLPLDELRERFDKALDSFQGFDGVNNHMGSKFTAWPEGMEMVIGMLKERELFFLDSRTGPQSLGIKIAQQKSLPVIGRDVFLDDDMKADAVKLQLAETERVARHKGYAIAIGHPHPATLDALESWIPEAEKQGFEFVRLRELVK